MKIIHNVVFIQKWRFINLVFHHKIVEKVHTARFLTAKFPNVLNFSNIREYMRFVYLIFNRYFVGALVGAYLWYFLFCKEMSPSYKVH